METPSEAIDTRWGGGALMGAILLQNCMAPCSAGAERRRSEVRWIKDGDLRNFAGNNPLCRLLQHRGPWGDRVPHQGNASYC